MAVEGSDFFHWDDAVRSDEAIEAYYDAIRQWGTEAQYNKAAEESSEFAAAINRMLNPESDRDDVLGELIDVRLILEVLRTRYSEEELRHRMEEQVADFRRRVEKDSPDGFAVGGEVR